VVQEHPELRKPVTNQANSIPLSAALIVLFILHRRNKKKLRIEDANDPHKSLDFGLDGVPSASRGNKRNPEMSNNGLGSNGPPRKALGLSMDMNLSSPYLLPSGLRGSRESFRSISRSITDEHDPYRPVAMLHSDSDSIRSGKAPRINERAEQGSLYSLSMGNQSHENSGLMANARPMSQSYAARASPTSPYEEFASNGAHSPTPHATDMAPPPPRKQSLAISGNDHLHSYDERNLPATPEPAVLDVGPPRTSSYAIPPRKDSAGSPNNRRSSTYSAKRQSSIYGDGAETVPDIPVAPIPHLSLDLPPGMVFATEDDEYEDEHNMSPTPQIHAPKPMSTQRASVVVDNTRLSVWQGGNNRLSVVGLRPLPPDIPDDNPEVRANRIRSFYREYFDESKPNPTNGHFEEEYDPAFLDAYDTYIPGSKPFAQGPGRRAFTPPPRGPPRGSGHSDNRPRKFSTSSAGPRGRKGPPAKKMPPPMTLTSLPTPYLLKEDSVVFNPIDFAPPSTFRNLQHGSRPDSPAGTPRPYSPAVRAFTPLASSFDTLTVMPSPHELRKSSTFTALDFALPSRIRDPNASLSPSDAGSIRSYRSGISAMQSDAIRQGAYRVSRIPKDMVTTRDDFASQLKPRMNLVEKA
jgi:hypothetical protein